MSEKKTINIFTAEGEVRTYERVSSRLPKFFERFPIGASDNVTEADYGLWRVVREVTHASELAPGLLGLYRAAIEQGKDPKALGLPALPTAVVFRSTLVNPQGHAVASGSTLTHVRDLARPPTDAGAFDAYPVFKDWERAETNAMQRLLASVGMGGEVLDDDEDLEISRNKSLGAAVASDDKKASGAPADHNIVHGNHAGTIKEDPAGPSIPTSIVAAKATVQVVPTPATKPDSGQRAAASNLDPTVSLSSLQRQIDLLSKNLRIKPTSVTSVEQADGVLQQLEEQMTQRHQRHTQGG